MNAKEYLSQYNKALRYTEKCFERLEAVLNVSPGSPKIDGMPKGGEQSDLSEIVGDIIELQKTAEKAKAKALKLAAEIIDTVNSVSDQKEKELLWLRYIDGRKWEEVAEEMHYSSQHIYRLHGQALQSIDIIRARKN